jgi:poly-beta-1,6-N-acetyl-D-glucosamine synthase
MNAFLADGNGWLGGMLAGYAFYYPFFMAWLWMLGGLYYYVHWERRAPCRPVLPEDPPGVSIIVPCFNEGSNVGDTLRSMCAQDYPLFEVIAVNDGSTDDTATVLDAMLDELPGLRVVHLAENRGKAAALRVGALLARHEILVTIDGDALLESDAVAWLVPHFVNGPRVGAVTGNPRIRSRSTLLGRLQVGEFSSIVGLIKRAQRIYGRIFTVSGVVTAFRRTALQRVGFWSTDMVTEDIDISWKLQLDHWDIRYEPNCLCWILTPETLKGLWRQRLRWAQGGAEVLFKYAADLFVWRKRRMFFVYLELILSVLWSYLMATVILLYLIGLAFPLPPALHVATLVPGWTGVVLGLTCLLQFALALAIDGRYERGLAGYYFWIIWYPLAYWLINVLTTVVAVPRAWRRRRGRLARWVSPDRGIGADPT